MFIQVMQGKSSKRAEVRELGESGGRTRSEPVPGSWVATFGFTDDDDWFGVVRFESREAAMANSERPETGEFSAKMAALMDGPMEFHDSDDVIEFLDGGSDDAKFVQIIRGRSDDRGAWKTLHGRLRRAAGDATGHHRRHRGASSPTAPSPRPSRSPTRPVPGRARRTAATCHPRSARRCSR